MQNKTKMLEKYAEKLKKLENEEMDPDATLSADFYLQLMALHLLDTENIIHAKFLWKRIPSDIKKDNKDLAHLELLRRPLSKNNYAEFFKLMNTFVWPENIREIMMEVKLKTRNDLLQLIGLGYRRIYERNLLELTQLPREQLKEACLALDWSYVEDGVITPKKPPPNPESNATSEAQLLKLTELLSFLEN